MISGDVFFGYAYNHANSNDLFGYNHAMTCKFK